MSKKKNGTNGATAAAVNLPSPAPIPDFEEAAAAYKRVEPKALALKEDQLTPMNVDVVSATSIILGVASRILTYRARMADLPAFDIGHVDGLVDNAKASWFATVTNLPERAPKDYQNMLDEASTLRSHLLTWAAPLVHAQKFDQAAIDTIKEGAGNKDLASDVVALVTLYRSRWTDVRGVCGVTEAELDRGAALGPALFAAVSRRENKTTPSLTDGSLRVRRFWTLADVAYDQCQRAIAFFEWGIADYTAIAPALRRNSGTRSAATTPNPPANPTPPAPTPPAPAPSAPVVTAAPQLGGNGSPFAAK